MPGDGETITTGAAESGRLNNQTARGVYQCKKCLRYWNQESVQSSEGHTCLANLPQLNGRDGTMYDPFASQFDKNAIGFTQYGSPHKF